MARGSGGRARDDDDDDDFVEYDGTETNSDEEYDPTRSEEGEDDDDDDDDDDGDEGDAEDEPPAKRARKRRGTAGGCGGSAEADPSVSSPSPCQDGGAGGGRRRGGRADRRAGNRCRYRSWLVEFGEAMDEAGMRARLEGMQEAVTFAAWRGQGMGYDRRAYVTLSTQRDQKTIFKVFPEARSIEPLRGGLSWDRAFLRDHPGMTKMGKMSRKVGRAELRGAANAAAAAAAAGGAGEEARMEGGLRELEGVASSLELCLSSLGRGIGERDARAQLMRMELRRARCAAAAPIEEGPAASDARDLEEALARVATMESLVRRRDAQVSRIEGENVGLEAQLAAARDELGRARVRAEERDAELDLAHANVRILESKVGRMGDELRGARAELQARDSQLAELRDQLAERSAELQARDSQLDELLERLAERSAERSDGCDAMRVDPLHEGAEITQPEREALDAIALERPVIVAGRERRRYSCSCEPSAAAFGLAPAGIDAGGRIAACNARALDLTIRLAGRDRECGELRAGLAGARSSLAVAERIASRLREIIAARADDRAAAEAYRSATLSTWEGGCSRAAVVAIRDCKATAERAKQIHDRLVVLASEAVRREAAMSERDAELRARAADVVDREESVRCRERLVAAGDDVIDQLQSANSALRRELELRSTNTEVYATIRSLIDSNAELCATSSSIVALRDEARARVAEADERLARLRPVAASAEAGLARAGGIESVCRALQDATDRAIRAASGIEAQVAAMDEANAELRGVVGAYIEHVGGPLEARLLSEWRLAAVGGVTLEASLGTALLPDSPASAAGALGGP